ncbi:MAG TPA: UDP-2,3-diacylglucosamine diphosphatase, partial [Panacibacter sp.]|nr:UDP-2,3-diacylglucosamine diphosphatase [Panacibacter sp.]
KLLAKLGGHGYDLLILINRFINWFLKLAGREKMSLSKRVKNSVKKAISWIGDFEQTAAELAIAKHYDYVICGHIHQPQQRIIETREGKVTYLNSGDWVENLTSLEYNEGEWKIYHYNEKDFLHKTPAEIKMEREVPRLNVVTDEVAMFINSLVITAQ